MLVAGVDSSTQSTKIVLCRAEDGEIVASASAPHPGGTETDPDAWWAALQQAGAGLLPRAAAVGVAGQQHGMIVLDESGEVIRPALLWNDLRSAAAAAELVSERGGPHWWAAQTGSVPTASFTVTKLRWLASCEPTSAARAAAVLLPHDWLTWRLRSPDGAAARLPVTEATTDRGDASGTGYFSPAAGTWLADVAAAALGHPLWLPRVARPGQIVGETPWGATVSAGTGDNMGAALGLGLEPGDVAVSIGTSGTAFAVSGAPSADPTGAVAGFADATGRFLPLVCTVNAALVLTATAALLGTDADGLSAAGASRPRRRGRPHPAALPGRRADPGPAECYRRAARADHEERDQGKPRPCRRRGRARLAGRRRRPADRPGRGGGGARAWPAAADRRRRTIGGGAAAGAWPLRDGSAGARAQGVRRGGRCAAGRMGPGRHGRAAALARPAARGPLQRAGAAGGQGPLRCAA